MGVTLVSLALAVSLAPWPRSVEQRDSRFEMLSIRVLIYGKVTVRAATFERAIDLADRAFSRAGIAPEWVDCGRSALPSCAATPAPGQFLLRIIPNRLDRSSHGCGVSLRPPGRPAGHLITIYADCIRKGSDELRIAEPVVLAYTIVHEIGHLLLPEGHSFTGIMRARPDHFDWQRAARSALTFTDDEVRQIRARLIPGSVKGK